MLSGPVWPVSTPNVHTPQLRRWRMQPAVDQRMMPGVSWTWRLTPHTSTHNTVPRMSIAGIGSVIIDSQPLTVAVLAALLFGEQLGPTAVAGLLLGVAGLLLMQVPEQYMMTMAGAVRSAVQSNAVQSDSADVATVTCTDVMQSQRHPLQPLATAHIKVCLTRTGCAPCPDR